MPKMLWVMVLVALAEEQAWRNFKAEAARFLEDRYEGCVQALHNIWMRLMRRFDGPLLPEETEQSARRPAPIRP